MRESEVVIAAIPQSDGVLKDRPAIILREMPPYNDLLLCGISSRLHQKVAGFDELINPSDSDFADSGLRGPSLIRLGFLALVPQDQIVGSIGTISPERHRRLLERLAAYLTQ